MSLKIEVGGQPDKTTVPVPSPEMLDRKTFKSRLSLRAEELMADRIGLFPVWIRAPKNGSEFYSGFSRAKLYILADQKHIRSVSIREPGKMRGTRLFHLQSILDYIDKCEADHRKDVA